MKDFEDMEDFDDFGLGFPKSKEKEGIFSFLNKVLKTKDSTKTGFLNEEELRVIRLLQSTGTYANAWGLPAVEEYLKKDAEGILASSDSKEGFLVNAAITSKKQIEKKGKSQQQGGFKLWGKKQPQEQEE